MSDSESPKRKSKSYCFDPKKPQAIEKLKRHIAAKAKKSITSKNNLGKVVANKAAGKYVSTYAHAVSGKFTIDLSEILEGIKEEITKSLKSRCTVNIPDAGNEPGEVNEVSLQDVEFIWSTPIDASKPPTLKLKAVVVAESDTSRPIEQLTRLLQTNNDVTQKMSVKYRCGQAQGAATAYKFNEAPMKTDKISTTCATSSDIDDADCVLSSMITECLSTEHEEKFAEYLEQCEENDIDISQSGKLALEWLQNTYGVANMEFIQLVQKYMEYLSTTKTADQNLYDFAKSLKSKLNALHDSKWSMTDLYNVLILAHAMKSDDVDERGNKVDYSSITKLIKSALNKGERLDPRTVVDKLETEAKTAKSALKLVTTGTAAEALHTRMAAPAPHVQAMSAFDKTPPSGFGFPRTHNRECLWCAHCAKSKKHKATGWNGWNQLSVTNCKAHMRIKCPFEQQNRKRKSNKENKPLKEKSLAAQVETLTTLVAALSNKM